MKHLLGTPSPLMRVMEDRLKTFDRDDKIPANAAGYPLHAKRNIL
jgi:hypothetical protein